MLKLFKKKLRSNILTGFDTYLLKDQKRFKDRKEAEAKAEIELCAKMNRYIVGLDSKAELNTTSSFKGISE